MAEHNDFGVWGEDMAQQYMVEQGYSLLHRDWRCGHRDLDLVMYKDGIPNLRKEFPETIAQKFDFFTFAVDDERSENNEVIPGIGGMVYTRLGLGDMDSKNSYMPQIVLDRLL